MGASGNRRKREWAQAGMGLSGKALAGMGRSRRASVRTASRPVTPYSIHICARKPKPDAHSLAAPHTHARATHAHRRPVLALAAASIGTAHAAWCVLHVAWCVLRVVFCVGPCNRRIGTTSSRSDNSERRMSIRCGAAALRAEGNGAASHGGRLRYRNSIGALCCGRCSPHTRT